MENAIVTAICIILILVGVVTLSMNSFSSINTISNSMKEMESFTRDIRQTCISTVDSTTQAGGDQVEITILNDGNTSLAHFNKWDIIVVYEEGTVQWLPYTDSTPGWSITGLYYNDNPEIFEPNILNPAEEMKVMLKLSPAVSEGTVNVATISTVNGITTQSVFGW
jgi:archaellum component FlaF (FlaF/FlaG flagellin family)